MSLTNGLRDRLLLRTRWRKQRAIIGLIGFRSWLALNWKQAQGHAGRRVQIAAKLKDLEHPVFLRTESSDLEVLKRVFLGQEFAPIDDLTGVELVIDAGANIGATTLYFLQRFKHCHVIAVEPDPDNFALLSKNLEPYGERVTLLEAAVWPSDTSLAMSTDAYRDGRDWSKQVRPCSAGEARVKAVSISTLLEQSNYTRISLLKLDIEGAEVELFKGSTPWLELVDTLTVELHDDSSFGNATRAFEGAMAGRHFNLTPSADFVVCKSR